MNIPSAPKPADPSSLQELNEILASIENSGAAGPTSIQPVPPSGPPPGGRRPAPGVKPLETGVGKDEIRKLLEEHSAGVISEVRKLLLVSMKPLVFVFPSSGVCSPLGRTNTDDACRLDQLLIHVVCSG